jgi:hypothetical protein
VTDRCDSTLGVLVVLAFAVPTSPALWLWALVLGPASHAVFSRWLKRPSLLPLARASAARRCGGKATSLARLMRLGFSVPPGFVVTGAEY